MYFNPWMKIFTHYRDPQLQVTKKIAKICKIESDDMLASQLEVIVHF